ncbi:MAG: hypothetical protein AB7Y46_15120 [Armatimonadota bacterium]
MSDLNEKVKAMNRSVSRWARRTTTAVSQWWEEVNALQERRSRIRALSRERHQLLLDIGNKVYTLHRKAKVQNRDLLADCERIDRIGADIAQLEREIEEIKRARAAQPREIEIEDQSPVVAEEDAEVSVGAAQDTPQVEKELTEPCAHTMTAVEGPADEEADMAPPECPPGQAPALSAPLEDAPEVEKATLEPPAHGQTAVESPSDDEGEEAGPEADAAQPPASPF